jgi:hypothetical protein
VGPEIPGHVDLRGRAAAQGLRDHPIEHLGDPRGVADLFLPADHVLEQRHLRYFLKAALPHRLVGGLRRDQQHWRVVPIGGLDRRDEARHAGPVLRDRHRDSSGGAAVAVAHQSGVGLVRAIPKGDARTGKHVRDRHHRRADDPERMFDSVKL